MKVFEELERLKQHGPYRLEYGICSNVRFSNPLSAVAWFRHQEECFNSWTEFSGNLTYPVPAAQVHRRPGLAYDGGTEETMWSMEHPYGKSRWRLLDHCIKWFKERNM